MTGYAYLAAMLFLVLKQRVWQVSPTSHEGWCAGHHCFLGDKILGYFFIFPYPLSIFIAGATYSRSRLLGNFVYDAMLALTGIFGYFAARDIFGSEFAALCGMLVFYWSFAARQILGPSINLESYTFFFSMLGLLLVVQALRRQSLLLVFLGVATGCLGVFCKLTSREVLWSLGYILLAKGFGLELLVGCSAATIMAGVFFLLLRLANDAVPDEALLCGAESRGDSLRLRMRQFMQFQKYALDLHYQNRVKFSAMNIVRELVAQYHKNMGVYYPLAALFLLMLAQDGIPWVHKATLLLFVAATASNCFSRLSVAFVSWIIAVFPLGVGAGLALESLAPFLRQHWFATGALAIITFGLSLMNYRAITYWTGQLHRAVAYYTNSVLALRDHVGPDDYLFCNSLDADIYYSLRCKTPPLTFLFMLYMASYYLENFEGCRRAFTRYFRDKKPKYIVDTAKDMDLDFLQAVTGLEYTLVRDGVAHIYALKAAHPAPDQDWDPAKLYAWNANRFERERAALADASAQAAARGEDHLARGEWDKALPEVETALLANTGIEGLFLLKARALAGMGRCEEAELALRRELAARPGNEEAWILHAAMAERLARDKAQTPLFARVFARSLFLWQRLQGGFRLVYPPSPWR